MAFEGLTEKISATFKKLRGKGRLKESDVKEAMREIRMALLEADVSYKVVKDFTKSVTERCIGADVLESLTPAQMIVKIVNDELTHLMGSDTKHITYNPNGPTVVMLVGLQGAGKTTNGSKLAGLMKRQGKNPLLVACDIYRPAAITQLKVCGEKLGIPVFDRGTQNPVETAKEAVLYARQHGHDMVFLDTAGRLHIDEQLMEELKNIKATVKPNEIMLVVDAMTGQDAVNAAQSFNEWLDIDSSSPVWAKSWRTLSPSIRIGWLPVFWAWAICCPSSKKPRRLMMPRKPLSWKKSSEAINLPCRIITTSWFSSSPWAPLRISSPSCPAVRT